MTSQQTWNELNARIAQHNLLLHPFYQAWKNGELTREDLREYASDYYHHVAAFPTYLSALHSRLEDGEVRRSVLRNLADEEIHGKCHSDLWLDFAAGFGADVDAVRNSAPSPEMAQLIAQFRTVAKEGATAEALAAFYAYESQIPAVAEEKLRGLKDLYGADDATAAYFKLHQTADVHHAANWRSQLEGLLVASAASETAGEQAVNAAGGEL